MEKTIYIHIGPQKTGTSSLINFFLKNKLIFAANGCKILVSEISNFSWVMDKLDNIPYQFKNFYFSDNLEFPDGIPYEGLKKSYEENISSIYNDEYLKYILISDYYLCKEPQKVFKDIEKFNKIFTCSVREQLSFYQSYFSELLKCPNVFLEQALEIMNLKFLDYCQIQENFSKVPNSKMIFIPYNPVDNTESYLECVGIKSKNFSFGFHENPKLPNSAVNFLFNKKASINQTHWKLFIKTFQKILWDRTPIDELLEAELFYDTKILDNILNIYKDSNANFVALYPQLGKSLIHPYYLKNNLEGINLQSTNKENKKKEKYENLFREIVGTLGIPIN